jgi:hypothetical protein
MICAIASDPELPSFVKDPGFVKEFQKHSGMPLGDFLGRKDGLSSALGSALGRAFDPSGAEKLASALRDAESAAGSQNSYQGSVSVYARGSGGSSGGASLEDPLAGMGDIMKALAEGMNPSPKTAEKFNGVTAVAFANRNRAPAAVAEDRQLSIFDRITYRYYLVGRKILSGEGAAK